MRSESVFPDQAVGCQTKILFARPLLGSCARQCAADDLLAPSQVRVLGSVGQVPWQHQ